MIGWDRHLEGWIVAHRVGFIDPVAQGLSYAGAFGTVWLAIALGLALWLRRAEVLAWTLLAFALAWGSTEAVKAATSRSRPDVDTLVPGPHTSSFPSSHASTSFACATVLASFAPRLRVPLYALAVLIALSRTYVGVHFPLDVAVGAAWGLLVGLLVVRALRPRVAARRRSRRSQPAG